MAVQLLNEKREYPRMASNRLVLVEDEAGKTKQLIAINFSTNGMALHSNAPLVLGEFIYLRFRSDDQEKKVIEMTAEVMQNFKEGNAYVVGVKFVGQLPLNSSIRASL